MKNYELLYILPASETSEEIVKNFQEVQKHLEKFGATMLETLLEHPFLTKAGMSKEEEPDEIKALPIVKRKLAYPVKHERLGYYCLVNFAAEGKKIEDIDEYLRLNKTVLRHIILEADPMTREELERLQTLFARKKAEQEKEEAESGKGREERKNARKETVEEKKEEVKEEIPVPQAEEKKEEAQTEKEEEKEAVAEEEAPKAEKEEAKPVKAKEEKTDKAAGAEKKDDSKSKKSKIKLEDLEDKLDAILEDTIV